MPAQGPSGSPIACVAVGHEYRQDDLPAIASAPDGTAWIAWLSFGGDRDDIGLRRCKDGKWGALQWVPNTSGDSWLPQVAVDAQNRLWLVWSQMAENNWDLYARRFNPEKQAWDAIVRLTSDPLPDVNPRLATDGKGKFALVWQGFRGRNSNIFLKTFDGERWSNEIRITNRAANDWEPAAAFDGKGDIWVAYDSYKSGSYDVLLSRISGGALQGEEMTVAGTPLYEARATVAVDKLDRVWVAWEEGRAGWGKDQGYILRQNPKGVQLGGIRTSRIRCLAGGEWKEPVQPLSAAFPAGNVHQPHVLSDGGGSVWVAAKRRHQPPVEPGQRNRPGYWYYLISHLDGEAWQKAVEVPNSWGRSSTRFSAASDGRGLWLAWDTDGRLAPFSHRPHQQRVYAGRISQPPVSEAALRTATAPNVPEPERAHADEPGDLKAIRAYSVTLEGKQHNILRGDFHRHTELSWDGGGGADGSLLEYYRYMFDAGGMDFGASTDHQGGAWPYWWWYSQKMTDMYHVPGAFAGIFGYERSALFPNGHRNMFFVRRQDSKVTPFFMRSDHPQFGLPRDERGDESGIGAGDLLENDTKALYEEVRRRNAVVISHTSGTRMGTDWRDNDAELEPVVEIFQGARTNYESPEAPFAADPEKDGPHVKQAGFQPEGWVTNAWAKGYKLGIITSSDHGSTHISYAMVYTDNPSRQGILDAIRKRHTYGAMDNIILDVRMGQHFMGDEFTLAQAQPIRVKARGTRAVARVDIIKDGKVAYSATPNQQNVDFQFTDKGSVSGRHYYYVRVQQDDKLVAWSSPFFVNYK
jgi:hypothetical protein